MNCSEKGEETSLSTSSEGGKDNEVSSSLSEGLSTNQRSFEHYLTREVTPIESNYRDLLSLNFGKGKPSLDYLHNQNTIVEQEVEGGINQNEGKEGSEKTRKSRGKVVKFGWMEGVLECLFLLAFLYSIKCSQLKIFKLSVGFVC
ncbi:hypothetical protein Avbf_04641 [Armadillidium vulgare]|nr:hypothetical protein Avbf_04641 [Armadillidium vulgare]